MKAWSLNYRDLSMPRGGYPGNTKVRDEPPMIPLSDGAGEVLAVGKKVKEFKVGDRVCTTFCTTFFRDWDSGSIAQVHVDSGRGGAIDGVLAEQISVPERSLVLAPKHLDFPEAATLPCAALTAWNAIQQASLAKGDKVLILGTGGVSLFALQFAEALGFSSILTSSSNEKLERAKEISSFYGINYSEQPEWSEEVLRLTKGRGVDLVLEVGGTGTLAHSIKACAVGGNIALIGVLAAGAENPSPMDIMFKSLRVQGIYVGSRAMFKQMNKLISDSALKPIIDKEFSFDAVPEAYRYLKSAAHFGKIVIRAN
ncbi:UNVERIFIED_CONTAM: hypothetical protein GTU68_036586 [Idotea baltica]|nr:hypothetical protein [Idotea baltica]